MASNAFLIGIVGFEFASNPINENKFPTPPNVPDVFKESTPAASVTPTITTTPTISVTPTVSTSQSSQSDNLMTIFLNGSLDYIASTDDISTNPAYSSSDFSWPAGATGFSIEAQPVGTYLDNTDTTAGGKYPFGHFSNDNPMDETNQNGPHLFSLLSGDLSGAKNYGGL